MRRLGAAHCSHFFVVSPPRGRRGQREAEETNWRSLPLAFPLSPVQVERHHCLPPFCSINVRVAPHLYALPLSKHTFRCPVFQSASVRWVVDDGRRERERETTTKNSLVTSPVKVGSIFFPAALFIETKRTLWGAQQWHHLSKTERRRG